MVLPEEVREKIRRMFDEKPPQEGKTGQRIKEIAEQVNRYESAIRTEWNRYKRETIGKKKGHTMGNPGKCPFIICLILASVLVASVMAWVPKSWQCHSCDHPTIQLSVAVFVTLSYGLMWLFMPKWWVEE